jgi:hypothetical protein
LVLRSSTVIGLGLLVLILVPGVVSGSGFQGTVGIKVGDQLVYAYTIYSAGVNSNDVNVTSTTLFNDTINVLYVNTTAPIGYVEYTLRQDLIVNGAINATATLNNFTAIFNPFVNSTYLGNLGFSAFTYVNLPNGTKNFPLTVSVAAPPPWARANATTPAQNMTASVVRTSKAIDVSYADVLSPGAAPFAEAAMTFDPVSGVLTRLAVNTYIAGATKDFRYTLLSFRLITSPNYSLVGYIALGIVIVVVAAAVVSRPSRSKRKINKMREKFASPP